MNLIIDKLAVLIVKPVNMEVTAASPLFQPALDCVLIRGGFCLKDIDKDTFGGGGLPPSPQFVLLSYHILESASSAGTSLD